MVALKCAGFLENWLDAELSWLPAKCFYRPRHTTLSPAQSLNLSTDSWTVVLTVPYPDTALYGEDLSAMVALSMAAMATGWTAQDR